MQQVTCQDGTKTKERKRKAELSAIMKKIDAVEGELNKIDAQFASPDFYSQTSTMDLQEIGKRQNALKKERDALYEKWESVDGADAAE